jgi:fatty-acyl-CoA synthase
MLVAQVRQVSTRLRLDPDTDRFCSWLPPQHDMGLIGMTAIPLLTGSGLAYSSPLEFLRDPRSWLAMLSDFNATISAAPNFAFGFLARALRGDESESWSLKSMRYLANGSEPINIQTVMRFLQSAESLNLDPSNVVSVYGLAEATLAATLPDPGTGLRLARPDPSKTDQYPLLGRPVDGLELRFTDEHGSATACGELELRGSSVATGYLLDSTPLDDRWLKTGDLGTIVDGELIVLGRLKEMIIVGGRNVSPSEVEQVLEHMRPLRKGNVVAVSMTGGTKERFAVVAELVDGWRGSIEALKADIVREVYQSVGTPPGCVLLVPRDTLPKTTSGKLQRVRIRELLNDGELAEV